MMPLLLLWMLLSCVRYERLLIPLLPVLVFFFSAAFFFATYYYYYSIGNMEVFSLESQSLSRSMSLCLSLVIPLGEPVVLCRLVPCGAVSRYLESSTFTRTLDEV